MYLYNNELSTTFAEDHTSLHAYNSEDLNYERN